MVIQTARSKKQEKKTKTQHITAQDVLILCELLGYSVYAYPEHIYFTIKVSIKPTENANHDFLYDTVQDIWTLDSNAYGVTGKCSNKKLYKMIQAKHRCIK